jgi:5-methyltetrahydrofolate--homocysteine methyltransferase
MVGRERLCLADYIRSVDSGDVDVLPLQIVTVGKEATKRFEELQGKNEYTEAFYSHGLSVEAAEAVAEWTHRRIKQELGVPDGKRYSWGYGVSRPRRPRDRLQAPPAGGARHGSHRGVPAAS